MTDRDPDAHDDARDDAPARSDAGRPARRAATPDEVEGRVRAVRGWIQWEGLGVEEAVERVRWEFGVGRRQALRYWVRAYVPLLSEGDRRDREAGRRPRSDTGFGRWPSLEEWIEFGTSVWAAEEARGRW